MKFSANRLYVERYLKCANCGVLVYENDKEQVKDEVGTLYCTVWCKDWAARREGQSN